jgi:uncharacterized membrane protein
MSRRTAPAERDARAEAAPRAIRAAVAKAASALVVVVPLSAWLARWAGWPRLGDALALVVVAAVTAGVVRTLGLAMAAGLALTVGAVALAIVVAGLPAAFLPPVTINVAFAFVFAATLRGDMPLIERFARRAGSTITPQKARYCRRVTTAWALYLALLAAIGLGIALSRDERLGAWWAIADYALVGAFFAVEFAWRRLRSTTAGGWWSHVRNVRAGWRAPRG